MSVRCKKDVRLREGGFRDASAGIIFAEFRDDAVQVLLRAEALPLQYSHDRGNLPHVGDGRFFKGHSTALGAVGAQFASVFFVFRLERRSLQWRLVPRVTTSRCAGLTHKGLTQVWSRSQFIIRGFSIA